MASETNSANGEQFAAISKAIELAGGQGALARLLVEDFQSRGITVKLGQSHVWQWAQKGKVPATYVLPIERVTRGEVVRYELRPDIYPVAEYGLIKNIQDAQAFFRSLCGASVVSLPAADYSTANQQVTR